MHHSVPAIEGIIPSLLAVSRSITGDSALAIKEYVRKGKGAAIGTTIRNLSTYITNIPIYLCILK